MTRPSFALRWGEKFTSRCFATAVAISMLLCDCAVAAEPEVILLRGWFGVFSTGLDTIADGLKAKGINAEIAGHLSWSKAVSRIVEERAAHKTGPLVLIGHSQGANNVIDMARSLAPHNISVDLLVTLAPYLQNSIPPNVVRAINYYLAGGWGAPVVPDSGFRGKISNVNVADDPAILHITIDKSAKISGRNIAGGGRVGSGKIAELARIRQLRHSSPPGARLSSSK